VLTRIALASDAAGSTPDAISLLHEAVGMYLKAPAADQEERDLALARAHFHLGGCLLKTGMEEDGLAETEAGLELAADVLDRLQIQFADNGWLAEAPRYLQLAAPDWAAAAVRSMTLQAEAGRWQQAATAARAAISVSAGLAGLGGDALRDAHEKISARADEVLAKAKQRLSPTGRLRTPGHEKRARPKWNTHPFGIILNLIFVLPALVVDEALA
jgi:tetratricopeptide (TPR) repeat protein